MHVVTFLNEGGKEGRFDLKEGGEERYIYVYIYKYVYVWIYIYVYKHIYIYKCEESGEKGEKKGEGRGEGEEPCKVGRTAICRCLPFG